MRALSLFSGIGGIEIAGNACGIETVAFCEVEPYACKVLGKRFPGVPNVGDVTRFTSAPLREFGGSPFVSWTTPEDIGYVDMVYGGFPCQDLSVAGKQKGLKDEDGKNTRSGLWYEMLRVVETLRPAWVLAENVRGAIHIALDAVSAGLENAGYEVRPYVIPASAVGAPHKRERLFVVGTRRDVADAYSSGLQGRSESGSIREMWEKSFDQQSGGRCESGLLEMFFPRGKRDSNKSVNPDQLWPTPRANKPEGYASNGFRPTLAQCVTGEDRPTHGLLSPDWVENLMGFPIGWTDVECDEPRPWPGWPTGRSQGKIAPSEGCGHGKTLGGQVHGFYDQYPYEPARTGGKVPNRAKRLKALGNAVVPQQVFLILSAVSVLHDLLRYKHTER